MQFQENEHVKRLVRRLIRFSDSKSRGDIISHKDIEAVTGLSRNEYPWQLVVKKWKRHVRETRGIHVRVYVDYGYVLRTEREQVCVDPHVLMNRADRQLRQVVQIITPVAVSGADFDTHERNAVAQMLTVSINRRTEGRERRHDMKAAASTIKVRKGKRPKGGYSLR